MTAADAYAQVDDAARLKERFAFRTTRRASGLWKAVSQSGTFPAVEGENVAHRERLTRLNHERLAHLYFIDEIKELAEGGTALVTLWVGEEDGVIRTIEQDVWGRPVGCSPVMMETRREDGLLRIIWLDCASLEHELACRWFVARERTVIEPPPDPSEYVFAGNDADVLRYNRRHLDNLFDISRVASLGAGDSLYVSVWIERDSGLIDAYALDIRAAGQREDLVFAVAEVTREDRHGLIVRFVDTAGIEGIPRRVLEWFHHSFHSVMDPRRADEGTLPPVPVDDGCPEAVPISPHAEEPTVSARPLPFLAAPSSMATPPPLALNPLRPITMR